jgi:hypothetical protein
MRHSVLTAWFAAFPGFFRYRIVCNRYAGDARARKRMKSGRVSRLWLAFDM